MMDVQAVQLIDNHALIEGDLISVEEDRDRPDFVTLRVAVQHVDDVTGFPNFFVAEVGSTIAITVRRDSPLAARAAGPIRLLVKKTGLTASFGESEVPQR